MIARDRDIAIEDTSRVVELICDRRNIATHFVGIPMIVVLSYRQLVACTLGSMLQRPSGIVYDARTSSIWKAIGRSLASVSSWLRSSCCVRCAAAKVSLSSPMSS